MPIFEYRGLNKQGKNVKGLIDAENIRVARSKIKKDKIYIVDIKDKTKAARKNTNKKSNLNKNVDVQDLSLMTRQLAVLIKAGVPLVDSLGAVSDQIENPILSNIMAEIKTTVNEGGSLNKAMAKYPKVFDKIFVSMCEAGEMSGTLDMILLRLAEFTEAQNELNAKIRSAMLYPVLMMIVSLLLLAGIFIFIIPKMVTIFDSSPDLTLEWYTLMIIDISGFIVNYWWLILIFSFIGSFTFKSWKNTKSGERQWDLVRLKIPVIGKIIRMIAVSRFTRTLATLLTGGVPMLNSMSIVRNVVANEVLAEAIDNARDNISEGESIAAPLKKSGEFPPLVIHMISIGEKTGELENMLSQVSDAYDFQVKNSVEGMTSLLGPLMLLFMGGVIGVIVFAVMMPMFQLSSLGG
ncbi:MAG: type II secretion system inner membrane protein GspF [Bdellovibrionaceae bacterium]|nr:type II secretion system inner membrane protein GspF [Pseudobdellovibrionaceae bacterium]